MINRMRRLRKNENIRRLVKDVYIDKSDFIYPMFITEGKTENVESMPGIKRYSFTDFKEAIQEVWDKGIRSVLFFGIPKYKDEYGSAAYDDNGIVQRAIRYTKEKYPDMIVIADICLCEYTSHGHCGVVKNGEVLNDETLELLAKASISCAKAGADMVAPSDMMDGRVGYIRNALDENGYINTIIMSYSVKYASAFYGPFREAAHSCMQFGDRRGYQMDFRQKREAITETALDINEGADIIMVKPAMAYLDIVRDIKENFVKPLAVYHVSGEYSMIKAAAQNGWIDEKKIVLETMTAIKRAGADMIITYYALQAADWLEL